MLFNSFEFLALFLPVTFSVFILIAALGRRTLAVCFLILASLSFHAYWKASYTWLFVASMGVNYLVGIGCHTLLSHKKRMASRVLLIFGILFNLGLLGYFKYAEFAAEVIWSASGVLLNVGPIVLPLAISFYTFQQIAFLVDTTWGQSRRYGPLEYVSYLAFFPHLIAGPIVRHESLINQLNGPGASRINKTAILSGLAIIMIGLFKKVVIADGAALYVDPVFAAADRGAAVGFVEAWIGALLFSFVIYFDFSGYSDIAIGLARLFNVRFPENFSSPYKATNIADFWRRWHITLSRFLRDYVYIPLGGNRSGVAGLSANVMVTMLLGGLWHGAGWTFVAWGGLHGLYLLVFRWWDRTVGPQHDPTLATVVAGRAVTFLAVAVAWVFFRASSPESSVSVLSAMFGFREFSSGVELPSGLLGDGILSAGLAIVVLIVMVQILPNTQQYMALFRPVLRWYPERGRRRFCLPIFVPNPIHIAFVTLLGVWAVARLDRVHAFIYFQF